MQHDQPTAVKKAERGEILRFLALLGMMPATPKTILAHLADESYTLSEQDLATHLHYLEGRGLVRLLTRWSSNLIETATITPDGQDVIDKLRKGEGVAL